MAEEARAAKRVVTAPSTAGPIGAGEVISVEVGPDEDVEWIWSHDQDRGSTVTGYKLVDRQAKN